MSSAVQVLGFMPIEIRPGTQGIVTSRPQRRFRASRLYVSPESFALPMHMRVWVALLGVIAKPIALISRALTFAFRVDSRVRFRREYDEGPRRHDCETEEFPEWDDDLERAYRFVAVKRTLFERFHGALAGAALALSTRGFEWKRRMLSTLRVDDISIGESSQLVMSYAGIVGFDRRGISADALIGADLSMGMAMPGHEIAIKVTNKGRRVCNLRIALMGYSFDEPSVVPVDAARVSRSSLAIPALRGYDGPLGWDGPLALAWQQILTANSVGAEQAEQRMGGTCPQCGRDRDSPTIAYCSVCADRVD